MEVCVANLGPRQRRRRLLSGVASLAVAILAAAALAGAPAPARALVALPLFGAALGFLQYLEKT